MKIFVTGATGFVGREIVRQLFEAGHSIRILLRDKSSVSASDFISQYQLEVHCGNILDPESLHRSLRGVEAVIHLVGIISESGANTFEKIHVHGTENMVAETLRANVRRFIHMSALGARAGAPSRYHQSKFAAEEQVRRSGLDFTIFRPSIIYGKGDLFTNLFAKMSRWSPVLPIMGKGEGSLQPLPVEEVAHCFVQSVSDPRASKRTFDLCGPEVLTMPQILRAICDVLGRRRFLVHVPIVLANGMARCFEVVFPRLFGKAPPLNRDQLLMLQEKTIGQGEGARELFGLSKMPFKEGIGKFLT